MKGRDTSITVALCASLALHVLVLAALCEHYARRVGSVYMSGFAPPDTTQIFAVPDAPMPQLKPTLGELSGLGEALDSAAGDEPLRARRALQEQAFLSLDEIGPGERHQVGISIEPQSEALSLRPPPLGLTSRNTDFVGPARAAPSLRFKAEVAAADAPAGSMSPAAATASALAPADPAPKADTASDPFTNIGSAEFRAGSTRARVGRPHRLVPPRFTLASRREFVSLAPPVSLVLALTLDETGAVTQARIHRSSGSSAIDQACKLIAYKWWFQPTRDADGRPQPEEFLFTILFS